MSQTIAAAPASETRINTFLARVYLLMTVGLVVTGLVSIWISENLRFQYRLFTNPWLGWGLFILQIIVVAALSARVMSMSPGSAALLFLLYAGLVGITISSIFLLYGDDQIAQEYGTGRPIGSNHPQQRLVHVLPAVWCAAGLLR